jgi:hypothetical protein
LFLNLRLILLLNPKLFQHQTQSLFQIPHPNQKQSQILRLSLRLIP